jgi:hypothetical protein
VPAAGAMAISLSVLLLAAWVGRTPVLEKRNFVIIKMMNII